MSEEYYANSGVKVPIDCTDGGWRSATMKHCIFDNVEYSDIYNEYEGKG
jgi:hypothetical protein